MTIERASRPAVTAASPAESHDAVVAQVHERLLQDLDVRQLEQLSEDEGRARVQSAAAAVLAEVAPGVVGLVREGIITSVVNEVIGLGPLQPLLDDPDISEIMVNGPNLVFTERSGRLTLSSVRFHDAGHIRRIADRLVQPLGRRLDEASPLVDARLTDGSRVNVVIPPIAPDSPVITIRKFKSGLAIEQLIAFGALSEQVAGFLRACVMSKANIIVSGGTGSGKTTMLGALASFIPADERIVTIEDPIELPLSQEHVISLEARPAGVGGQGEVSQRDLVRNALRMRPDRIVMGEVRSGEAFDMLQAMNTGHDGSLTTLHANNPRDAVARIENMVMMAGFDFPIRSIRQQIASATHFFIQISRLQDGSRKMVYVTEVAGMEGDVVTLQDIFVFDNQGPDDEGRIQGSLKHTGIRPNFADQFARFGVNEDWTPQQREAGSAALRT